MPKKGKFSLKEEWVFYIMLYSTFIALYLPFKFSERHKNLDTVLFKENYHLWGKMVIVIALLLLTAVAFYLAFRILNQYLIVKNNPISKIRSAAQGYIEIEGIQAVLPGKTLLLSPLSKTPCTWYAYIIEELRRNSRGGSYWAVKESGESKEHFMLVDTTGQCIICPEGADIFTSLYTVWIDEEDPRLRYTERLLLPNVHAYITGVFRTLPGVSQNEDVIEKHKEVSALIKKWKQDYSVLLEKYDTNKNGKLDEDEWRNVIKSAEQEINNQYPTPTNSDGMVEEAGLVNIISKEGRMLDQPFLISNLRKSEVLKKFHAKFAFYLVVFFVSAIAACTPDTWYYDILV